MNLKTQNRLGWAIGGLPALMLIASAVGKLSGSPQVAEGFEHLGWPVSLAIPIAILEILVALIYLFPRTAVLGAILVAGYMGGAIATHVRLGEPFLVQSLIGISVWAGLYLRDPRLRVLIPFRRA